MKNINPVLTTHAREKNVNHFFIGCMSYLIPVNKHVLLLAVCKFAISSQMSSAASRNSITSICVPVMLSYEASSNPGKNDSPQLVYLNTMYGS